MRPYFISSFKHAPQFVPKSFGILEQIFPHRCLVEKNKWEYKTFVIVLLTPQCYFILILSVVLKYKKGHKWLPGKGKLFYSFSVYKVFENVAQKYDVMNDAMSFGIHRLWKDALLHVMHPQPGAQLLDMAGGTGKTPSACSWIKTLSWSDLNHPQPPLPRRHRLPFPGLRSFSAGEAEAEGGSLRAGCTLATPWAGHLGREGGRACAV